MLVTEGIPKFFSAYFSLRRDRSKQIHCPTSGWALRRVAAVNFLTANPHKQHVRLPMADSILSPLHRADGSAKYAKAGYSIVAAVNGPIEVQRRDEIPEEAAVDVAIRPAAGVGGK